MNLKIDENITSLKHKAKFADFTGNLIYILKLVIIYQKEVQPLN